MKICCSCKKEKPLSDFNARSRSSDGLESRCRECKRAYNQEYYQANREKARAYSREYYYENREKALASRREYVRKNKEEIREKNKKIYQENREKIIERRKKYCQKNKEKVREQKKKYYQKHKEKLLSLQKENKDKSNAARRKRRKENEICALADRSRSRIRQAFKGQGWTKRGRSAELLGCSWDELKQHIERQFLPGMTWANRSEWHIDHVVPLASASTPEEVEALCHHTNLRPIWAEDNQSKRAKREFLI